MLYSKNTEQLKADTERKGEQKAGNCCCLPRLRGGRAVPGLELSPAELQISNLLGKIPLGQSKDLVQPCSMI